MNLKMLPIRSSVKTHFLHMIATMFCFLLLTACGEKDAPQSSPAHSPAKTAETGETETDKTPAAEVISIKDAYIRAMPPGQKVTAMFLILHNSSNIAHSLVKAESDVSDAVELHEHKHVDGVMKMRQVSSIDIPKNGSAALAPGGYHVMMIGLKQDLELGEKVAVKMIFQDGSSLDIEPEVKQMTAK